MMTAPAFLPSPPFVLVDTEYTTWEGAMARGWSGPGERREIIQIGALIIGDGWQAAARFIRWCLPVFNPVLSDYCVTLTGVTQEKIDLEGMPFRQALQQFVSFSGGLDVWCYGKDWTVLRENCEWHGMAMPLDRFRDVRDLVRAAGHNPFEWTSGTLHRLAGLPRPGGREHDALDDCLSIAAWMSHVSSARRPPMIP